MAARNESEILRKRTKIIRNWRNYAEKIEKAFKHVLGEDAEVYTFGSAFKGNTTARSDIDILIVTNKTIHSLSHRNRLGTMIEDAADLPNPHLLEIHIATRDEAPAYFRHAGPNIVKLEKIQN